MEDVAKVLKVGIHKHVPLMGSRSILKPLDRIGVLRLQEDADSGACEIFVTGQYLDCVYVLVNGNQIHFVLFVAPPDVHSDQLRWQRYFVPKDFASIDVRLPGSPRNWCVKTETRCPMHGLERMTHCSASGCRNIAIAPFHFPRRAASDLSSYCATPLDRPGIAIPSRESSTTRPRPDCDCDTPSGVGKSTGIGFGPEPCVGSHCTRPASTKANHCPIRRHCACANLPKARHNWIGALSLPDPRWW